MRYIALLRGINVGGNTMIKMEELRKAFEALGFENVKSYINSGNLAFDAIGPHERRSVLFGQALVARIESAIENTFGKNVSVMVRKQGEIGHLLKQNPFAGQYESHKEMHVLFLKEKLTKEQISLLRSFALENERFEVNGREIFCHLPLGVANSLLGRGLFERKLKTSVTARNWRTVEKLAEL